MSKVLSQTLDVDCPEDWEVVHLSEISNITYGKNLPKKDLKGVGYPVYGACLLYTSPSPRDQRGSRMPSSA